MNQENKTVTTVFRTNKHEGMYLYVNRQNGLADVPEMLLQRFGEPVELMTLVLTPEKKLAQANAADVINAIKEQGFYLQITKEHDAEMLQIAMKNSKL